MKQTQASAPLLDKVIPVVLCGGSGTRLWPLSRHAYPKQFVSLYDDHSLLAHTLRRVQSLGVPICMAQEAHRFYVQHELERLDLQADIYLEPMARDTAAAIASAIHNQDPDAYVLIVPADHYLPDTHYFLDAVGRALVAAQQGHIVTFGIAPRYPATAYGYISAAQELLPGVYAIERFIEKPSAQVAKNLVKQSQMFWNAGIFLAQVKTLQAAFEEVASEIWEATSRAVSAAQLDGYFMRLDRAAYETCPKISFDYAVMERVSVGAVVPYAKLWSDVGSWAAVSELMNADADGNRLLGDAWVYQGRNNYVRAPHRPVVTVGVDNLVIVDTPDALLVCDRAQTEVIKEVVAQMQTEGRSEVMDHRRVERPWGWFDVIDRGPGFVVKRLGVRPGAALSLQLHQQRAEHWVVVTGSAEVTLADQVMELFANQSTYIPPHTKHRLANRGTEWLEIIEVQTGQHISEDDIERFADDFGRAS